MTKLYIEAFSGLSGDMFLGALAALTNSYDELLELPKLLRLDDAKIKITQVDKNGIVCQHVKVIDLNEPHTHHDENHDQAHHHDDNGHHHHEDQPGNEGDTGLPGFKFRGRSQHVAHQAWFLTVKVET